MTAKFVKATETDPTVLLNNLKAFLQSNPEWADYNFDGGTLGMILSLFAQNTYYGALYDNMVFNEAHIDSAQLRDSIVSRAKLLGFVPRSAKSAKMVVNVRVYPDNSPDYILMPRGTRFRATYQSRDFYFLVAQDTILYPTGLPNNSYAASNVTLAEGFMLTHRFTYNSSDDPSFTIPNRNVDTDSLYVYVQETAETSERQLFTQADDLSEVNEDSPIYFLEENFDGKFRIFFGDGIMGRPLSHNNVVVVEYRVCQGDVPNGIRTVSLIDTIGGYTSYDLTIVETATGGQNIQDKEEIRFHAPRFYEMQNRVVIESDYVEHILNAHSDIESVSCWGGQKNNPPLYGKTCISLKPFNGFRLTTSRKQEIVNSLTKLNPLAIDPVLFDPKFLYVSPVVSVTYDKTMTTLTQAEMHAKIASVIQQFETDNLKVFNKNFSIGKFIQTIINCDVAITDADADVTISKRFSPILNSEFTYRIKFHQKLHTDTVNSTLGSTALFVPSSATPMYLDDAGNGRVRIVYYNGNQKIVFKETGTINYETGEIVLNNFAPSNFRGDEMRVVATPANKSITTTFNEILLLSDVVLTVTQEGSNNILTRPIETEGSVLTQVETGVIV